MSRTSTVLWQSFCRVYKLNRHLRISINCSHDNMLCFCHRCQPDIISLSQLRPYIVLIPFSPMLTDLGTSPIVTLCHLVVRGRMWIHWPSATHTKGQWEHVFGCQQDCIRDHTVHSMAELSCPRQLPVVGQSKLAYAERWMHCRGGLLYFSGVLVLFTGKEAGGVRLIHIYSSQAILYRLHCIGTCSLKWYVHLFLYICLWICLTSANCFLSREQWTGSILVVVW